MQIFGLASVCALLVLAVIGPFIAPYPTTTASPATRLLSPSLAHWLGTDENGMDVFSRIVAAPRIDVSVAFVAIGFAVAIGTPLGVVAGFFEGSSRRVAALVGELILRLLDVLQAFPVFILAMVLVAIRGASTENIIIAVAFVNMPVFLRVSRAEILTLRERPFAEAARSIGATDWRIAFRHLLPNALPPLITQVSVTMGFAILLTAGLTFVGAGVNPPTPELGGMISSGSRMMVSGYWWPSLFPGVALGFVVFSFAAGGEALGRLLEPRSVDAVGDDHRIGQTTLPGRPISAGAVGGAAVVTVGAGSAEDRGAAIAEVMEAGIRDGAFARDPEGAFDHGLQRPADCLLVADGLCVEFGEVRAPTRVLDDVSLWVSPGEAFGVVGGSGSGKSVLARALLRLLPEGGRVAAGTVFYRDWDLLSLDEKSLREIRSVEFAPILPSARLQLSPVSTVGDLMVLIYRSHQTAGRKEALERAVEALRLVGIQDPERRLKAYPHELSGGMAQRICIALALLHHPRLVIADEPTSGLDVTVQRQVLDQMVYAARERGAAQLIVTRDLGIVAQYCERVAVMHHGRIVESGNTTDVFGHPQHPFTRRLLAAVDLWVDSGVDEEAEAAS